MERHVSYLADSRIPSMSLPFDGAVGTKSLGYLLYPDHPPYRQEADEKRNCVHVAVGVLVHSQHEVE